MCHFPFLGIVVLPFPQMDDVGVAGIAVFQCQHIIGIVGELDDINAFGDSLGESRDR